MLQNFFTELRSAKVPVSLREYLSLIEALDKGVIGMDVEDFYFLSRAALVKDERHIDRFDQVFSRVFKGLESLQQGIDAQELPEEWLRSVTEKYLTEAEKAEIEALGGWDKLMETLKKRLEEQKERHQGGNKWIGTGGTSPFGADGYNPEGVRIGQKESRHRRAVKVWDKREFRNYDDDVEIGTRNIKVALKRLRKWVRSGAEDELDLSGTIDATARQGWLDVRMRPERRNAVKVLMLLDVGGSMDDHVKVSQELFSAARSELKHLEFYYFHNCPYEGLWKDNRRRRVDVTATQDVLHTYGKDWKVVIVGDAAMSPYEITVAGGAVEYFNAEPGAIWLQRIVASFPELIWLNPIRRGHWEYTASTQIVREIIGHDRMFEMTLQGLDSAFRQLGN